MPKDLIAHPDQRDSGFGLAEAIVAMMIIAILSIAFLPVLITGLKTSTANTTRAIAIQVLAQELEQLRNSGSSCTAVKTFMAATPAPIANQQGTLQASRLINLPASDVCSAPYLRTVSVRLRVTDTSTAEVLAEAHALVVLDAE